MIRSILNHKTKALAFLLASFMSLSFLPLHHGWSSYDQTKKLTVSGKITQTGYESPHGMITLQADKKTWTVVLAPPSRMESRGLLKDMLQGGTTVIVEGYPHLKIKDEMRAERITIKDKTTELR